MNEPSNRDVVSLLLEQHAEIRSLLRATAEAPGDQRRETFQCLVRLLAVHETAEEEVVHPAARRADGGDGIVEARLAEEDKAKTILSELEDLGVEHDEFLSRLSAFEEAVLQHASMEEQLEFPL